MSNKSVRTQWLPLLVTLGLCSLPLGAQNNNDYQDQQPQDNWRKFGDQRDQRDMRDQRPPAPAQLTAPVGTWITVRVNQVLSSDRNQPGDAFTATLVEPIIVDGLVAARRGETVGGRVTEVQKAGHVKGTSRLGIELTELSLVDGQQVPLRTQFIQRNGDTSVGRDVAAVGTTTAVGAAVGAAAAGGFGAGLGAAAGAGASLIGVLVTRGRPTIIYPETVMTFRLTAPLTISTVRSSDAYQPVEPQDYPQNTNRGYGAPPPPPPAYGYPYPDYYASAPYYGYGYGYGYPYYWGSGFYFGPSLYFGGFYGRGYRGGYWGGGYYRGGYRGGYGSFSGGYRGSAGGYRGGGSVGSYSGGGSAGGYRGGGSIGGGHVSGGHGGGSRR